MGAGSPLRCLRGVPATHLNGSTLDKVSQGPSKNHGERMVSDDPRFAESECSSDVFQITPQ